MPQFWKLYHRLIEAVDDDGLPDPDKHDAAHWMNELYLAVVECADTEHPEKAHRVARMALDSIRDNRPRIFPLGATP